MTLDEIKTIKARCEQLIFADVQTDMRACIKEIERQRSVLENIRDETDWEDTIESLKALVERQQERARKALEDKQ